jgi:hypothetical protein
VIDDARGPAAADEVGAIHELLEAQLSLEAAEDRSQDARRRHREEHLERSSLQGEADTESGQKGNAPGAGRDNGDVAGLPSAVPSLDRHHVPALGHQRSRAHTLVDPNVEPPGGRGEGLHGGHRFRLAVDGREDAAEALGRYAGRETPRPRRVDELERYAVGSLLVGPAPRRAPGTPVEGHAESAAAPVPGLAFQLPIEPGPARQALESKPALGRIAAHDPYPGRARSRGGRADTRALEHGHGPPRIRAAKVKGRAQAHEAAAHDHDRHGGKPSLVATC